MAHKLRSRAKRYELWPSNLRAGHTSVSIACDSVAHDVYGIHMAMQKLPCCVQAPRSETVRIGGAPSGERWKETSPGSQEDWTEVLRPEACLDFMSSVDVLDLTMVKSREVQGENDDVGIGAR